MKHIHKITFKEVEPVRYSPDYNHSHEIQDWGVYLSFYEHNPNYSTSVGPFTKDDLKRLSRVIRRAIKAIDNHGNN